MMRRRSVTSHALLLTALLGFLSGSPGATAPDPPDELRIGLIPEMNIFRQVERFEPLADYLSAELEIPVRLTMLSRYGNIVDRISNNEIDAAFLGSFTGALAIAQLDMTPIARPVNLDGTSTYYGRIFVRKDSSIRSVEEMEGARLALVERATTAGYVFPLALLRDSGVGELEGFFRQVEFWGSHDAAIYAVLNGRADVGAAKNTIWERMAEEDPTVEEQLLVLADSERVPSNGLMVSSRVSQSLRERLRKLLLDLVQSQEGRVVLSNLRARRFVPTQPEDYRMVFTLAEKAGIDLRSYRYMNQ